MSPRLVRTLAWIGAVVLFTTPLTYLFTAPSNWVVGVKAACGAALLALSWLLGKGGARPTLRGIREGITVVLALTAVVGVNLATHSLPLTRDLTRERIHSLAPQTQSVLAALSQPIQVIAVVPESHPAREPLEQLAREYVQAAHGKLSFTAVDSRKNPQAAARFGLRDGEMAVVLERQDGARTALAAVSEAELTQALLRLSRSRGLTAYFVQGHGEPPPEVDPPVPGDQRPLRGFSQALVQEGYVLQPLNLKATDVPPNADVVLITGPQSSFSSEEVERLSRYLDGGGHLGLFVEPNISTGQLAELLVRWGILLDPGVVAEPPAPGVESPYEVVTSSYAEHPISRVLRQGQLAVTLVTARGLTLLRQGVLPGVVDEPVVFSGPNAWEESQGDASPQPSSGEKAGRLVLGAASRRGQARLFVLGEADLVRDVLWGNEPNRNLVLSAVAWLADPTEAGVALRPVDRAASSLELPVAALRQLRFWSVDVVPLVLFSTAMLWMRRRRSP
jgi:hypothetical protein